MVMENAREMIGYITHSYILDFCNSEISYLYVCVVYNSTQKFTIIIIIKLSLSR